MKKRVFRERYNNNDYVLDKDKYFTFKVDEPKEIKSKKTTTKKRAGK